MKYDIHTTPLPPVWPARASFVYEHIIHRDRPYPRYDFVSPNSQNVSFFKNTIYSFLHVISHLSLPDSSIPPVSPGWETIFLSLLFYALF